MPKKVYYSKPLKYFWHEVYGVQKNLTPFLTDDQIFVILKRNLLNAPETNYEGAVTKQLAISGLELWRKDAKGELVHIFFLDKHLRDFLMATPLSDLEGIKRFLYEEGKTTDVWHYYSNTKTSRVSFQFALHIPFESVGYAFSLGVEEDGSLELFYSLGENGGRMSDKFYTDVRKQQDESSQIHAKFFRLAINTIAYMNCFPDCVTDGVPQNLFTRDENLTIKNVTLQVSDKVKEIDGQPRSRIPHFRSGHFRVLKSDRYTHKKGQVIFIADTMVKGKAKTVETANDLDKFHNNSIEVD